MVQTNQDTKFVRSIRRRLDVLPSKSGGAASSQQGPGVATPNSLVKQSRPISAGGAVSSLHDSSLGSLADLHAAYSAQLHRNPPRQSGVATSPRGVPFGGGRVVHPLGHLTAALSATASSGQASIESARTALALLRPVIGTRFWKSPGQIRRQQVVHSQHWVPRIHGCTELFHDNYARESYHH